MPVGTLRAGIEPFFFSARDLPLFGVYHAPRSRSPRDGAVVLCYPVGREYVFCHRTYRQLAARLSGAGFHVLRFDYFGCGDSAGGFEEWRIHQWVADVSAAVNEIRQRCGLFRVCLVGLRLGGTLSVLNGAERGDIDAVVLWNPVVQGGQYIEELRRLHLDRLRHSLAKPDPGLTGNGPTELLGFPYTEALLADIRKTDLFTVRQRPADKILVIESSQKPDERDLIDHLQGIGAHVDFEHRPCPQFWTQTADKSLVPTQVLQPLVAWISKVYS